MMGDKFWSELRATIAGLNKKPMVKTASAKDPNRVAVAEAKASGFFVKAKAMGWGLYQVEELDGGLGSIWHVEKDAATGEQFLVKQVDPVGDIVRRVKTAAATGKIVVAEDESIDPKGGGVDTPCKECGKPLGMAYFLDALGICTDCVKKRHKDVTNPGWRNKKASIVVAEDESIVPQGKDDGFGDQDNLIVDDQPEQPAAPEAPAAVPPMNDMVKSYLGTALWAETDNADERGGEPLDKNYDVEDFAPEAVAKATADCAAFEEKAGPLLEGIERQGQDVPDVIGFHFWLTRNHHGAGFWDGDYPKEIGEALTKLSHEFREQYVDVGDDGKLYLS
jgi:hypothetical protein